MSYGVRIMMQCCRELGIPYSQIGSNEAMLSLLFGTETHMMLNNAFGLNTDAQMKISVDKYYLYELLFPSVLMPLTRSYIDPHATDHNAPFVTYTSEEEICTDIKNSFQLPVIVKRNSGTQGENVFLCHDDNEIMKAIKAVYSKQQIQYDHVLLAETYIKPKREFRVIVLEGKVELIYHKDNSSAQFRGNLSPLHWHSAVSKIVDELGFVQKIQSIVDSLYTTFPIVYAGLDIIESTDDKLYLIEVNSTPQFGRFLRDNDSERIKQIFIKALILLQRRYKLRRHFPST